MAEPLVSIIIPTFNRCELLAEALDSVAAQTFGDYEIVVIDDGSTDRTEHMVNSRSEPIRYFRQHNQGVAAARNHALRQAKGSLVAFLDSDDIWLPQRLEATVALLQQQPQLVLAYCDSATIDATGRPLRGHHKTVYAGDVLERLFASIFIHTPCVTVHRHHLLQTGGFNTNLHNNEDYELWLRLALEGQFGLVRQVLCQVRSHTDSLTRNSQHVSLLTKVRMLEQFYRRPDVHERIAPDIARRRLARVHYSAGKAMLKVGHFHQASQLLSQSLRYRPGRPKPWSFYLLSRILALVSPSRPQPDQPKT